MSKEIKIVVLGGSGMLGSMINDFISRNSNFSITSTVRNNELMNKCKSVFPKNTFRAYTKFFKFI